SGANLAHAILAYARPASIGILVTGSVGLLGELAGQPPPRTAGTAVAVGLLAAMAASWLPPALNELSRRGARLQPQVGQFGIAVETVPADGTGFGAVRVTEGGKHGDFLAQCSGGEVARGFRVRVVAVLGDERVLVVPG